MSGLEVIGVVASIIQIADLGTKVSVKLCTFYRTVKVANQSMKGLSRDVSLTCSILSELGKILEHDDQANLCSKEAFYTTQAVLKECNAVFKQIESAIEEYDQGAESNIFRRRTRKITAAFFGPDIEVLKSNLERLKSTILLMLHVIMYAGQLRKREERSPLSNQRDLIQTLLEEKRESDHNLNLLSTSFRSLDIDDGSKFNHTSTKVACTEQRSFLPEELDKYYTVIQKLLCEIDTCQNSLDPGRHLRIRNGVVNVHSAELAFFQHAYGHVATQLFDDPFFKLCNDCFPQKGVSSIDPQFTNPETVPETTGLEETQPRPRPALHPESRPVSKFQNPSRWDLTQEHTASNQKHPHQSSVSVVPYKDERLFQTPADPGSHKNNHKRSPSEKSRQRDQEDHSLHYRAADLLVPGHEILVHESSEGLSEEDGMISTDVDSPSAVLDEPARYGRRNTKISSSLTPTQDDERIRLPPWHDSTQDSPNSSQCVDTNSFPDALMAFNERTRDLETASLSATLGDLSTLDLNVLREELLSIESQPKKRKSLFKSSFQQASSILKRQASDLSMIELSTHPKAPQRDAEDPQLKYNCSTPNHSTTCSIPDERLKTASDLHATSSPKLATNALSHNPDSGDIPDGIITLEALVLLWTNLTPEEMREE